MQKNGVNEGATYTTSTCVCVCWWCSVVAYCTVSISLPKKSMFINITKNFNIFTHCTSSKKYLFFNCAIPAAYPWRAYVNMQKKVDLKSFCMKKCAAQKYFQLFSTWIIHHFTYDLLHRNRVFSSISSGSAWLVCNQFNFNPDFNV